MALLSKEKYRTIIASRGVIYLPKKIKSLLGIVDHKSVLISLEDNKIVIEIEPENKIYQELETKKNEVLDFIEKFNLSPKENISVEEFMNEARRY